MSAAEQENKGITPAEREEMLKDASILTRAMTSRICTKIEIERFVEICNTTIEQENGAIAPLVPFGLEYFKNLLDIQVSFHQLLKGEES